MPEIARRISRPIRVPLLPDQSQKAGKRLACFQQELDSLLRRRKEEAKEWRDAIKDLRERISAHAEEIALGIEEPVDCSWEVEGGRVLVTRMDTAEIIEDRAATPEDYQTQIDDEDT